MSIILDQLSFEEQKKLLSSAAALILPNPGVGIAAVVGDGERASEVLKSLRSRFSKNRTDEEVDSRIVMYLTDKLKSIHLSSSSEAAAKARLSDKGLLSRQSSSIVILPIIKKFTDHLLIRPVHIEQAIKTPDSHQYVNALRAIEYNSRFPLMSIYMKNHHSRTLGDYSLLVICAHSKGHLVVNGAYRIYQSDITISHDASPLATLKALIETYGVEFSVAGSSPTKFMLNEIFPPGEFGQNFGFERQRVPGEHVFQMFFHRTGPLDLIARRQAGMCLV